MWEWVGHIKTPRRQRRERDRGWERERGLWPLHSHVVPRNRRHIRTHVYFSLHKFVNVHSKIYIDRQNIAVTASTSPPPPSFFPTSPVGSWVQCMGSRPYATTALSLSLSLSLALWRTCDITDNITDNTWTPVCPHVYSYIKELSAVAMLMHWTISFDKMVDVINFEI